MIPRPDACMGCPLNETSVHGFCPDKIPSGAKYIFLAEAPGVNEIKQAVPMVGRAGFVLHNWLLKAVSPLKLAWEKNEIGLANVLRCLPKEVQGRAYPRGKDKAMAEHLCRQYDHWPDSVHTFVLFGEHAQRLFFGKEIEAEDIVDKQLGHDVKGVLGRVGKVYEKEGRKWVCCIHPAAILRSPSLVEHGQNALRIAASIEKIANVSYGDWNAAIEALS